MNNLDAPLSDDQRNEILNNEIEKAVSAGWKVQSSRNHQAVLSKNKRIGWFWNSIFIIISGGIWLIPVAYWILNRKQLTLVLNVAASGKIYAH